MKFITAEQFLQADKRVVDSIVAWWKPSIGDLIESTVEGEVWCLVDETQVNRVLNVGKESFVVPLLTVGQLIEYIENIIDGKVDIESEVDNYTGTLTHYRVEAYEINCSGCIATLTFGNDVPLVQALWELCKVVYKEERLWD